jgi:hypothetical protein
MRRLLLLSPLLFAFIGDQGNPNPLTFWWWKGNPQELRPALECALTRVRNATCLDVDVSFDAHHLVSQKAGADMPPGQVGHTGGSSWYDTRIDLQAQMGPNSNCRTLVHEIAQHVLRRSNSHVGAPWRIDADLLTAICSVQDCKCFNPETTDNPIPEGDYGWSCADGVSQCD